MITSLRARLLNILIALDQFVYVLLTMGHGSPDETMSAAAYRLWLLDKLAGRYFKPAIDLLFLPMERDHCRHAYLSEMDRRHLPGGYTQ